MKRTNSPDPRDFPSILVTPSLKDSELSEPKRDKHIFRLVLDELLEGADRNSLGERLNLSSRLDLANHNNLADRSEKGDCALFTIGAGEVDRRGSAIFTASADRSISSVDNDFTGGVSRVTGWADLIAEKK